MEDALIALALLRGSAGIKGKSSPAEYEKPGHVDVAVVNDIAAWILAMGKKPAERTW